MTTHTPPRPDIFSASFSTGDLVRSADITAAAFQTWIRRGQIVGTPEGGVDMPGGPGFRRAFSFENVMEVTAGAALIKGGNAPAEAFKAARKFAYTGADDRRPGVPFRDGLTLLCVDGDRSCVIHVADGGTVAEMNRSLMTAEGFYLLRANAVFDRAVHALGWHPEEVLEAAYSEACT